MSEQTRLILGKNNQLARTLRKPLKQERPSYPCRGRPDTTASRKRRAGPASARPGFGPLVVKADGQRFIVAISQAHAVPQ
jgi:hypothetical protein